MFETKKDSSSVSLRLPPSPTGEGFFDMQKAKKSPARGGAKRSFRYSTEHCKNILEFMRVTNEIVLCIILVEHLLE